MSGGLRSGASLSSQSSRSLDPGATGQLSGAAARRRRGQGGHQVGGEVEGKIGEGGRRAGGASCLASEGSAGAEESGEVEEQVRSRSHSRSGAAREEEDDSQEVDSGDERVDKSLRKTAAGRAVGNRAGMQSAGSAGKGGGTARRRRGDQIVSTSSCVAFSEVAGIFAETGRVNYLTVEKPLGDRQTSVDEILGCKLSGCRLSVQYRAPSVCLSRDRLAAFSSGGWASCFATRGADCGSWYYEVTLGARPPGEAFLDDLDDGVDGVGEEAEVPPPFSNRLAYDVTGGLPQLSDLTADSRGPAADVASRRGHVRVGWSCRYCRYDTPVGHSAYSVAISSVDGSVFNDGKRYAFLNSPLDIGDVVGCYIHLTESESRLPDPRRNPALHTLVEAGMLCDPEKPPEKISAKGSFVEFSVNGIRQGRAPLGHGLWCGEYHPAVSIFNGAVIKANFGPDFAHPPQATTEEGILWECANVMPAPRI